MTTITKTTSNRRGASATPSANGIVISTIGTAPRRPAHERKPISFQGIRCTTRAGDHRQRSGHDGQHEPGEQGHPDRLQRDPSGREQQPQHHEEPDLGEPGDALGEGAGGAAVGQLGVSEDERGDVHRREPGGVHERRGAVGEEGQREHRDGVQARRRQGGAAHQPHAAEAEDQARRHAEQQLVDDDARRHEDPVVGERSGGDEGDEHDRRGVVEARLDLERTDEPLAERHHAQHGEDGGRVGRRRDGAEQDRELPRQTEQVVRGHGHHGDRHRHADGGQRDPEPHRRAHLAPLGGQAALGQDHRQGGEAEGLGDFGVLELDADPGLAERDAHQQVDEQAGQPSPRGDPDGEDRQDRDRRAHQQEEVELMDVEAQCQPSRVAGWRAARAVYRAPGSPRTRSR